MKNCHNPNLWRSKGKEQETIPKHPTNPEEQLNIGLMDKEIRPGALPRPERKIWPNTSNPKSWTNSSKNQQVKNLRKYLTLQTWMLKMLTHNHHLNEWTS